MDDIVVHKFDGSNNESGNGIVTASYTVGDITDPVLQSNTPANNATDVDVTTNIVLNGQLWFVERSH